MQIDVCLFVFHYLVNNITGYISFVKTSVLFEKLLFSFKQAQTYFHKQFQINLIHYMSRERVRGLRKGCASACVGICC